MMVSKLVYNQQKSFIVISLILRLDPAQRYESDAVESNAFLLQKGSTVILYLSHLRQ